MYVPECVPQSNLSSAQLERNKTKEQLEEEKRISLSIRIKPLTIDGLSVDKLRDKARELWDCIVKLETEKYDLEERQKRQDYDVSSIHIYEYVMYYTYPLPLCMHIVERAEGKTEATTQAQGSEEGSGSWSPYRQISSK